MKLLLSRRAMSYACDWREYALVRDNVQHFIEGGEPSRRFAALHGMERAVDAGSATVDAAQLRGEVLRAWYALSGVPAANAAVSLRTRVILTGNARGPARRKTAAAAPLGWSLPVALAPGERVAEGGKRFVATVLALTQDAVDGDTIEVRREGHAPRHAAA
jgi:hypothetical protein